MRSLTNVLGSERDVAGVGWRSRRLLVAADRMGFSLHDTVVDTGADLELEYRHHLEACYVMAGEAEVMDLATGERHALRPGSVYALDGHDRHRIRVQRELRLVCVFNPPLAGGETHDATGSFPSAE